MPPKNTIELSECRLYFNGVDVPAEIHDCEAMDDPEYAKDQEPYIKLSQEPAEFTVDNVEFAKDWTLVKCHECGSPLPVSELYVFIYGVDCWICPMCTLKNALADMKKGELNA